MDKAGLVAAIEARKGTSSYSAWTIGITDDTERRKGEHESEGKDVKYWTDWEADSESIARDVEDYFLKKGMKGGGGGGKSPDHVYIF
jgi:hypothetical protein